MRTVDIDIDELEYYEDNPRYNDDAVEVVAASIKEFGFKVPLVVDKNNVIVCGHTRYKASLLLGLKRIPCIIADDLSEEQIKAFRLVDNKVSEYAEWDLEKLNGELSDIELNMLQFGFDLEEEELDISDDDFIKDTETTKEKTEKYKEVECPFCHERMIV